MTKESSRFQEIVQEAMHEYKYGKLKSGVNGKVVKDKKQAINSAARSKGLRGAY